jgi:hypothetical protein
MIGSAQILPGGGGGGGSTAGLTQATWYLSAAGSVQNSGIDAAHPIPASDLQRRIGRHLGTIPQSITITNLDATPRIAFDIALANGCTCELIQANQTVALAGLTLSTVTAVSVANRAFLQGSIAAFDWSPYVDQRMVATSGTNLGAVSWITKVNPKGAGGADMGNTFAQLTRLFVEPKSSNNYVATNGDPTTLQTFAVQTIPQVGEMDVRATVSPSTVVASATTGTYSNQPALVIKGFDVAHLSTYAAGTLQASLVIWGSKIRQWSANGSTSSNTQLIASYIQSTDGIFPTVRARGVGCKSTAALALIAYGNVDLQYVAFEGVGLNLAYGNQHLLSFCGFSNAPASTPGLAIGSGVQVKGTNLVGQNNATYGATVDTNGTLKTTISGGAATVVGIGGVFGDWQFASGINRSWLNGLPREHAQGIAPVTQLAGGLAAYLVPEMPADAVVSPAYKVRSIAILTPLEVTAQTTGGFTIRGDTGDSASTVSAIWKGTGGAGGVVAG